MAGNLKCKICNKAYKTSGGLLKHLNDKHGMDRHITSNALIPVPENGGKFKSIYCRKCGRIYHYEWSYQFHLDICSPDILIAEIQGKSDDGELLILDKVAQVGDLDIRG